MANTESQDDRIKTSNFNMGRKSLYKKINLETYKKKKGVLLHLACKIGHSKPGAVIPPIHYIFALS